MNDVVEAKVVNPAADEQLKTVGWVSYIVRGMIAMNSSQPVGN